jgi:hypothetical protein
VGLGLAGPPLLPPVGQCVPAVFLEGEGGSSWNLGNLQGQTQKEEEGQKGESQEPEGEIESS